MKAKLAIVLVFLSLMVACSSIAGIYNDPAVPILVNTGSQFIIELPSNATTGYSWEFSTPVDAQYLSVVKSYYTSPDTTLAGAGGIQGWRFEPLKPGTTTIALEYKRPWEKAIPAIQVAVFNVTIQ